MFFFSKKICRIYYVFQDSRIDDHPDYLVVIAYQVLKNQFMPNYIRNYCMATANYDENKKMTIVKYELPTKNLINYFLVFNK